MRYGGSDVLPEIEGISGGDYGGEVCLNKLSQSTAFDKLTVRYITNATECIFSYILLIIGEKSIDYFVKKCYNVYTHGTFKSCAF